MELLTESKRDAKTPAPVMGMESSHGECGEDRGDEQFYRTAECAYYKAEARGFEPGHDMEDWFAAEAEKSQ